MTMNYEQNQYSKTKVVKTKDFFPHCMPGTGTNSEAFTFQVKRNDFRCPTHVLCKKVLLFHIDKYTRNTIQSEYWFDQLIKNNTRI